MFANWNLLIPADKDKSAPRNPAIKKARLTSITYPRCIPLCTPPPQDTPSTVPSLESITQLFSTLRKPSDVLPSHLQLLNVSYTYDLPLSSIVPTKYHPNENDSDENSPFNQRKNEIVVENQDAYDFIARRRRDIKIGNFYKFFQAMEMVELILSSENPADKKDVKTGDGIPVDGGAAGAAARSAAKYREELLRNFIDPIAWGFDMRIYPPRYPPKLLSNRSLFSVKADLYLHSQPPTIQERKEGVVLGPAAILQTRNEESFTETDDVPDAVHELLALLTLSQERSRTGMHKKVRYQAVGKDKEIGGDDLFLFSSVNHHLAVSHVFLTQAYIKFIRTGQLPSEEYMEKNPQWCCCRIGRSKWYSLIEVDGRIDALKAVMAVMNWLRRTD
ncbi:hypothetical protein TWF569_010078 [Orbilia oligospora]|uniref:Uncharacterized protein n=1 Tax=Orbilia oligospora TaxID=2813651 RepID=A0A7C8NNF3_ORBOL|nr:hypothetical protein TWF706_006569 [Orbilia oligospora]KAF3101552.1 hypothetical protein TWF102_004802 [Orbilia oligospora]KAF3105575.1 hypothetical protein TWF103_006633 [Orbilia oligospora]KAF3125551.1 hypothetical protein TWF594_001543 [Orbilia oligospora]KAF3127638.1 hypothetical protein TWF703_009892 [Orbilia oligospora]